jgi:hypothetical protein
MVLVVDALIAAINALVDLLWARRNPRHAQ